MNKDFQAVWKEYESGVNYNQELDLYKKNDKSFDFYNDNQWKGVNAPDLDKPIFNIIKPIVSYMIANVVSDDVAIDLELFNPAQQYMTEQELEIIDNEFDNVIEQNNLAKKFRKVIKQACITGDGCLYAFFDESIKNQHPTNGEIRVENIKSTDVIFGNVTSNDVQSQPYIIIIKRMLTDKAREMAIASGVSKNKAETIVSDDYEGDRELNANESDKFTTVLTKFWKENGTVHYLICTKTCMIKDDTDLEYQLYPVAFYNWEEVEDCYHGEGVVYGKIPNQIYVNKLYAMAMQQIKSFAFPKIAYDSTLIEKWTNKIGEAIRVNGNPNQAIMTGLTTPDMSNQVFTMVREVIDQTKNLAGATDVALGNVKNPENTSAILAVQNASAFPLTLQKMNFYSFVEELARIFLDIMRVDYGVRYTTQEVPVQDMMGNTMMQEAIVPFDYSRINSVFLKLNVEVGASNYWSEISQMQTLDNMFLKGVLTDPEVYVESTPNKYLPNKQGILNAIREQKAIQQQQAMMQQVQPNIQ